MTSRSDQLYAALDEASSQVPYTVTRTPDGFRVELALYTPDVRARDKEMKLFTITAAKAWVRELLEANGWKVGGIGALLG